MGGKGRREARKLGERGDEQKGGRETRQGGGGGAHIDGWREDGEAAGGGSEQTLLSHANAFPIMTTCRPSGTLERFQHYPK